MSAMLNTHQLVKELQQSGVPEAQAEAQVNVLVQALDSKELTTKSDLKNLENVIKNDLRNLETEIEAKFSNIRHEITLMKWMLGFIFAGILSIFMKSFF